MEDKNLTIIEEIAPIEDITDEDIPTEDFAEDDIMIIETGGVELNSLDFVPESGKLVYSENQAIFNGEFKYTTKKNPQKELVASGSISFGIKGADGITVETDEDSSSVLVHIEGEVLEKINGIDSVKLDITTLNELVDDLRKETLKIDGILAETNYEMRQNTADIQELQMGSKDLNDYITDLQTRVKDIEDLEETTLTTNTPQIIKKEGSKIFEKGFGISSDDGGDVVDINNYGTAISFLGADGKNIFYLNILDKTASAFNKRLAFYDDLVEQHGTKVLVDGKFQETFNADLKADKIDIQNFVDMKKVSEADTGTIMNTGRTVSMGVQNQDSGSILGLSSNSLQLSISENDDESSMMMTPDHIDIDTKDLTWNGDTIATKLVNDLKNYYLKTQTYTKDEVNQLIGTGSSLHFEVVTSLPTEDISTTTIYLIAKPAQTEDNIYDEYIYVSSKWEMIGSTSVDLTNYYTKSEVDSKIGQIQQQVDNHDTTISALQAEVSKNGANITKNATDISNIDSDIANITETLGDVMTEISTLQNNVAENTADIKNKADKTELENKADKTELDNKVDKQDFDTLQESVDNHEAEIAALQADVTTNTTAIAEKADKVELNDYLPISGGTIDGQLNVNGLLQVTGIHGEIAAANGTFGDINLDAETTTMEEEYVIVSDDIGNLKKRAMNKMLDDIGGSTILVDGIRQDSFDMDAKQDKLTAGDNITIENGVISATGGESITVDSELSTTSENPVQNKVITETINNLDATTVKLTTTQTIRSEKIFADKPNSAIDEIHINDADTSFTSQLFVGRTNAISFKSKTANLYGALYADDTNGLILMGKSLDNETYQIPRVKISNDKISEIIISASNQYIEGEKNFTGGFKINGGEISYDSSADAFTINGNLIVTGNERVNGKNILGEDLIFDTSTAGTGTFSFLEDVSKYRLLCFATYVDGNKEYISCVIPYKEWILKTNEYPLKILDNNGGYMNVYPNDATSFIIKNYSKCHLRRIWGIV